MRLRISQHHVDYGALALSAHAKATPLEEFEHCATGQQNFSNQFIQTGLTNNGCEIAHKRSAGALSLIFVNDCEGYLGPLWLNDNITSGAHNCFFALFVGHDDQSNMIGKVDVKYPASAAEKWCFIEKKRR
jgi:hypothetical protein